MPQIGDDLPKLFRSLGRSNADLRSDNANNSRDAEKKWPLLKAMAPKEPPQIPPLTTQEKERWQPQESNEQSRLNRVTPPPGSGDQLGANLKRMSARANPGPDRPEQHAPVPEASQISEPVQRQASMTLLTKMPQNEDVSAIPPTKIAPTESRAEISLGALWGKKETFDTNPDAAGNSPASDSLKSVFSRLEGHKKETKPLIAEKRPSYLGRLGKK